MNGHGIHDEEICEFGRGGREGQPPAAPRNQILTPRYHTGYKLKSALISIHLDIK